MAFGALGALTSIGAVVLAYLTYVSMRRFDKYGAHNSSGEESLFANDLNFLAFRGVGGIIFRGCLLGV
jgi:hypothetical protein